ncbi:MAG: orotate phosphoribosyltransferase [Alphaproteobacteria bacterium]|nr:orotate phosphoribosyltransferase [Alphaproteobacteria bacterium]MBV9541928.1 orotate phosphoribosyltransferase [Alphaproteobacteria bacterium]
MQEQVLELLAPQRGHFLLESGHHGDLWFDLETLCLHPRKVDTLAVTMAERLAPLKLEGVCGALVEGAFVSLMVASKLDVEFTYSERFARVSTDGLFPAGYRIPASLRAGLRGKRVAVVNDVTNAGSAVRGTYEDLRACGAEVVAFGTLLLLGESFARFAAEEGVPLHALARLPNNLWTPAECPLCVAEAPLQDLGAYRAPLSAG